METSNISFLSLAPKDRLSARTLQTGLLRDGMNGVSFTAARMPTGWGHVIAAVEIYLSIRR